ncbi:MFS transporter (plasmid) [Sphingomonas panacis]|uniref:MFS transporter n=1 Tax=Sphingomonas panacis TaxID=1560345 RepID=A0A1B3ZIC8_9SPHN|nr:MFS transporter [Sphingomonas panacis]AOH87180.1 MFS transporter [Sphingomonas panacis]
MTVASSSRPFGLAASLAGRKIHYAWVIASVTFLTMIVTAGAIGAPGVLIGPLQAEFGWSAADISTAFAARFMLFGLVGPFAAAFMNRFGLRRVTVTSLMLIGLGIVGSLIMTKLWHLLLLWGVIIGLGTGLTAMVFGATVASRWFATRRGLILGLLSASAATGQLLFLPVLASLTAHIGWRYALAFLLVLLLAAVGTVLALMRDTPADVGLTPYGAVQVEAEGLEPTSFRAMLMSPLLALKDAARSATFWVLFGTFFVCGASTNGLVQTHFVAMCGDFGIVPVMAAGMLAMIGIFDLVGTIGSGWLSDRFDSRWLLFWYYGLRGLSLAYLPFSNFSFYELGIFAIFYGLDWVATVPPTVKLIADRFGEQSNLVFGWVYTGHQLGAALAAYAAGYTRSAYQSYLPAFFVGGLLCLLAAMAIVMVRERQHVLAIGAA